MGSIDFTAETAEASTVPEPFGKPTGPGLWHVKEMMLPAYVQHVAHALLRNGHAATIGQAIGMAKGIIADWQRGHLPGHKHYHVHADVRAAAMKADAEWQEKRARAHAQTVSHDHSRVGDIRMSEMDLATPKHPVDIQMRQLEGGHVAHDQMDSQAQSTATGRASTSTGRHPGMSTAHRLAQAHSDAVASLGHDHPHTKALKAELDAHMSGAGATKSSLVSHLRNVHRLNGAHDGKTVDQLKTAHSRDHQRNPNMHHSHPKGLGPTTEQHFSNSSPRGGNEPRIHYDAFGQPIDLAALTPTDTTSGRKTHRHKSSRGYGIGIEDTTTGDPALCEHPSNMSPAQLHSHLSDYHGMSVTSRGGSTIQDIEATRKMHAALHPGSYDLATKSVHYPTTGTTVVHHSSGKGSSAKKKGVGKKTKKGTYVGFEALVKRIMSQGKSEAEAREIAASIGRKKYGPRAFQAAATGHEKLGGK